MTSTRLRHARVCLAACGAALLFGIALPVHADDVNTASGNLSSAQAAAQAANSALAQAQQQLATAQQQLADLQQKVAQLDAEVASDTATVNAINKQLADDRQKLAAYERSFYESGGNAAIINYLLNAQNISQVMQRKAKVDHMDSAVDQLINEVISEQQQAQATLQAANDARTQAEAARQQAATQEAVIAAQEDQMQQAASAASANLQQAQAAYEQALAAQRAAQQSVLYAPVPGVNFSVDTDLTQPSGESADRLNAFLQGSALAGLGQSFMTAEKTYHVSARYFVAHAILESAWGTSAIARDKHNLFGFNANDSNPYGDASSFPSFDVCIQDVARYVSSNYLTPGGAFYHGPTLRGMNVDYATDPNWASKIARIAGTIP